MASDPDVERPRTDPLTRLVQASSDTAHAAEQVRRADAGMQRPRWETQFAAAVVVVDIVATFGTAALGHVIGFGAAGLPVGETRVPIAAVAIVLSLFSLFLTRAWDATVL